jgi:hypothetical protein
LNSLIRIRRDLLKLLLGFLFSSNSGGGRDLFGMGGSFDEGGIVCVLLGMTVFDTTEAGAETTDKEETKGDYGEPQTYKKENE